MKEILTKGSIYFLLPVLTTINEGLNGVTEITWNIQDLRVLVLVPLICGLTNIRSFLDKSYAVHTNGKTPKPNETTALSPAPNGGTPGNP